MANDLSASKLVDYAVEKASGKDALGSGKLVAYSIQKTSGKGPDWLGQARRLQRALVGDRVRLPIALISISRRARPSAPPQHWPNLSSGGSQSTDKDVLALIPIVL
jgi:hypothetical protein